MRRVDELTRKDLFKDVESKVVKRAKNLEPAVYYGITSDYVVIMRVNSSTGSGSYNILIELSELPSLLGDKDLTMKEIVRLSLAGDIKISCSCPAFRYWGYEYITTQLDSHADNPQYIYPMVRNPKLEGIMCKHCYKAVKSFGKYWASIAKDIEQKNFKSGV